MNRTRVRIIAIVFGVLSVIFLGYAVSLHPSQKEIEVLNLANQYGRESEDVENQISKLPATQETLDQRNVLVAKLNGLTEARRMGLEFIKASSAPRTQKRNTAIFLCAACAVFWIPSGLYLFLVTKKNN